MKVLTKKRLVINALITLSILSSGWKGTALADSQQLKIGLTGVIVQENLRLNKHLVEYIGEKLGVNAELVLRDTYQEMNDLLEMKEVDIAFTCSPPYIIGKEKIGLELLVVPQINGKPMYYSYVIVHKESKVK